MAEPSSEPWRHTGQRAYSPLRFRSLDMEKRLSVYPDEERREWLRRALSAWWDRQEQKHG